jgi:TolB protein
VECPTAAAASGGVCAVLRRAAIVVALTSLLMCFSASATPPGRNGKIAFSRYRFVNSPLRQEIWVAQPDGGGARRLTVAPANYLDSEPDSSPDGRTIAFNRCAPSKRGAGEGRCTIWTVRSSGSGLQQLSPCRTAATNLRACPDQNHPDYSPDGRELAFAVYTGVPGFCIADTALVHTRCHYPFGRRSDAPDIGSVEWSPSGNELALTVQNDNGKHFKPIGASAVFVIGRNGSGLRRLTPWRLPVGGGVDWSPDGSRVLFQSLTAHYEIPGGEIGDLYTITVAGSKLQRLTHAGAGVAVGSFSPDGTRIVYATTAGAQRNGGGQTYPDVVTIPAQGGAVEHVTHTRNVEGAPDWGTG